MAEPSASFQVKVSEVEFERTQMDVGELEGAALKTKGHFYTWHNADSLSDDLPGRPACPARTEQPPVGTLEPLARLNGVAAGSRGGMAAAKAERNGLSDMI